MQKDAILGENAKKCIAEAETVYFEVDMDDMKEMMSALKAMKMKNGVTLKSLLSIEDYEKVKKYFSEIGQGMIFTVMQDFKPLMLSTMMQVKTLDCQKTIAMEQVIMKEAKLEKKVIEGLETLAYQASLFDSIPYELQAKQLLDVVNKVYDVNIETSRLVEAYKRQDLKAIEAIINDEQWRMDNYLELLIYKRNHNWVQKLHSILCSKAVFIAVGAGHLPGKQGLIELLREEGYSVSPVANQ
ncbi:MAG: TraB/GumN family protein [Sphingobacteriales bacterium]|nr:TraB/GumN family protein [Sphingobacteriales bacterium]